MTKREKKVDLALSRILDSQLIKDGLRFQCQGSGRCCTSHGEYGFVYMTKKDRERMAKHLGLSSKEFLKIYCDKTDGWYHLKESPNQPDCRFLHDKKCTIYEARPEQCRTWPFWPEVLNAKSWSEEVQSFCPGIGKGRTYSAQEIRTIVKTQLLSELEDG